MGVGSVFSGIFGGIFKGRAHDFMFGLLRPDQVLGAPAATPIVANQGYLQVFSRFAWVPTIRRGFTRFYPAVYSSISLPTLASESATFQRLGTPQGLKAMSSDDLSRVIPLQQRLLGPIAYRGGDVVFELG